MSKYFSIDEVECKCGCGYSNVDPVLYELLDDMREMAGRPLFLNSCCRCKQHNLNVGGVSNSQHAAYPVTAADVDASNIGVDRLAEIAEACNADGIGRYYNDCFVHVDVRDGRVGAGYRW